MRGKPTDVVVSDGICVGIAHIGESVVAKGGVVEPGFRNCHKGKPVYRSVPCQSSSN